MNRPKDRSAAEADETPPQPEMAKERETKEDGRYIIFYDFDDEGEESGEKEES